jgi:uncharacterized protein YbbC (DUF1343 family)/CubicO group peptidase (beta-lactamase class C family)
MKRLMVLFAFLLPGTEVLASGLMFPDALNQVAPIISQAIDAGRLPGAVVLIGDESGVIYRRAFGDKAVQPEREAMAEDTIFDLASLTKAVATTTAVMQLVEAGKLDMETPVSRYWPAFASHGKAAITVRQLLTHYSGLRADLDLRRHWGGRRAAVRLMLKERPASPPGRHYTYSDINFEILGELVERVSGLPLDVYCRQRIFEPLAMNDTGFKPHASQRIAPTEWRRGAVHDPTAYRMGGVAGHAGLFSTADDLARFARMMLAEGHAGEARILQQTTIERMTIPQSPEGQPRLRGLGWDVAAPFAANAATLPPVGAYGHTGFTGTSLWIDPVSKIFVILLSNSVHPNGKGDVKPLRDQLAAVVGEAVGTLTRADIFAARPALAPYADAVPIVQTGLDVLAGEGYAPLKGLRVGLITNQTGRDWHGRRNIDMLRGAPDVRLVALFSPEHGLYGDVDKKVAPGSEPVTGLHVHSLYGDARKPTTAMLEGIDALVFDIQDAGARFYTYATTMAYAMEAAAARHIPIYVLDRPNPVTAAFVQGPMLDPDRISFTGYFPLPVRHGMTLGELARYFNTEAKIGADLHVIPMHGYRRELWYDDTKLPWVAPSPNLRNLTEAVLYPGVALIEGANVSVGRGSDTPFEIVGAPWIDANEFAHYLEAKALTGVHFAPLEFTPNADRYKGRRCYGVRITVSDRDALDSPALGVEIAAALHHLYPNEFRLDQTLGTIGARAVVDGIQQGDDPRSIALRWEAGLQDFRNRRAHYLLY